MADSEQLNYTPGPSLPPGPVGGGYTPWPSLPLFLPGGMPPGLLPTGPLVQTAPPDLGRADPGYTPTAPTYGPVGGGYSELPKSPSDDIAKAVINAKAIVRPPLPAPGDVSQDTLNAWARKQINPEKADVTYYTGNDLRDWLHQNMPGLSDFADALYGTGAVHVAGEADPRLWYADIQRGIEDTAGLLASTRPSLRTPRGRTPIAGNAYSSNYITEPMEGRGGPSWLNTIAVSSDIKNPEVVVHEAAHAGAKSSNKAADLEPQQNNLWLSRDDYNRLLQSGALRNLIQAVNGYDIPNRQPFEVPSTLSEVSYGRDYADPQDPRARYARILRGIGQEDSGGWTSVNNLSSPIPPGYQIDLASRVRDNLINKVIEYYVNGLNEAPPPGLPQ